MRESAWALALFLAGTVLLLSGCQVNAGATPTSAPPEEGGERMFVEAQLAVLDSPLSNYNQRPIAFGLIKGQSYVLQFTGEKFIGGLDDEMSLTVSLPQQVELFSGTPNWAGKDRRKSLDLAVRATENGRFIVSGTAENTKSHFSTTVSIVLCVGDSIEETQECVGKE